MKASFQHVQYNVADMANTASFYKELASYLGLNVIFDGADQILGIGDGSFAFWVLPTPVENKASAFSRDASGFNHLGLHVGSKDEVEQFRREFMQPRGIEAQFGTPRAREDFGPTYYQGMFVDPEGLAIEVFTS